MNAARLSPFILAALLLGSSVHAEPSAEDKRNATALVLEGQRLFNKGEFLGALGKFQAAHEILRDPTTGVHVARALEALGQLVEARAMVLKVSLFPAETIEPWAYKQARATAASAVEALDSRIPLLVLRIEGVSKEVVTATVDGKKIPADSLTAPLPSNPGKRKVVVSAPGYRSTQVTVELVEGIQEPVEVTLVLEREQETSTPIRENGFVYAGIAISGGLAAVAVGTGIGAALVEAKSNKDWGADGCNLMPKPTNSCYADFDEQEKERVRLGSIALGTVGTALAVGGGTLAYAFMTKAPEDKPAKQSVWVFPTLGGVVVGGVF